MSIRFIRDTADTTSDDVMSIRKDLEECEFVLTYNDENNGSPVTHTMRFGCRMDLVNHLYLTLKNQAMDDDGFKSVQFSMPAMPRMLVDAWKFKEVYYREHFLDLLENGLDCLDRVETSSPYQKAREKARAKAEKAVARSLYYHDFTPDNDLYPAESTATPAKTCRRSTRLSTHSNACSYNDVCEA